MDLDPSSDIKSAPRRHRRGLAMLLAIFSMVVVGTTTIAYVASRDTSLLVAANAQVAADARTLASGGMELANHLLRDGDSSWRTNHTNGRLLDNYSLDGGTVTIDLVDVVRRNAGVANPVPIATTTEVEVTVTSARNGTTWQSTAQTSIPSSIKSEYAIFANKIMGVTGSNNFIGRWPHAPMSANNYRVNIGSQALMATWNAALPWMGSGVWLQGGANFEAVVAGANPSDPDSMKSTWIYYPNTASDFLVQGTNASMVAAKRMEPEDSVQMTTAPTPPTVSAGYTSYTTTQSLSAQTRTYNPFRIRAAFLWQTNPRHFDVRNNSVVTLNAGTYEIWGSWILRNSRIIINGDVKVVVNPSLIATGLDWRDSSIELNTNANLEIYNGSSMDMRNCWVGSRYICTTEPNAAYQDGDPHKKAFFSAFTPTNCHPSAPSSPLYIQPWRIRFYPVPSLLAAFYLWDIRDSSVVGSIYLPSNPVRFLGASKVYGRVACNHLFIEDTSSFYYDHALDEISGLTEGTTPAHGGDSDQMFPVRVLRFGFDADSAR